MDLDTLAKLGEFVGGMFVVVSLVYLAFQVRQNTRSLRSENYARALERMSTLQSRLSVDPELHHLFMVGAEEPARLSRAERVRFSWEMLRSPPYDPAAIERWRRFVAGEELPASRAAPAP